MMEGNNSKITLMQTGERSFRITFGETVNLETLKEITEFKHILSATYENEIEDLVPCYTTLTVFFKRPKNDSQMNLEIFIHDWNRIKKELPTMATRRISIPVCYEEPFSIDRKRIEDFTALSFEKVIHLHTERVYTAYMIGFLPGFPYLGELNEQLFVRRLDKPRLVVPKGTVGIGGHQTGIYPIESPGGWNILGKTPLDLFSLNRSTPFLLQPKDEIQFQSITMEEFHEIESNLGNNPELVQEYIKEFPK